MTETGEAVASDEHDTLTGSRQDGTAYLDFSEDLAAAIGGGSMRELLTVYSIVDSVVLNVRRSGEQITQNTAPLLVD